MKVSFSQGVSKAFFSISLTSSVSFDLLKNVEPHLILGLKRPKINQNTFLENHPVVGPNCKNSTKIPVKNCEINWPYKCITTVWQIYNMKWMKLSESAEPCLKNSWNWFRWTYCWLILAIWNHCKFWLVMIIALAHWLTLK